MSLTDVFANTAKAEASKPRNDNQRRAVDVSGDRERAYLAAVLDGECLRMRETPEGQRNDQLNRSAFACAQFHELDESLIASELATAARATSGSPMGQHEITATIRSGIEDGRKNRKYIPAPQSERHVVQTEELPPEAYADDDPSSCSVDFQEPDPQYMGGGPKEDYAKAQRSPFDFETVDDIFAELPPVNWLCKELQLAPGRPNLLAGPGFGGKSIIASTIAFAVASGQLLFGKFPVRQGKVIHLNYDQGARVPKSRYQRTLRAQLMAPSDLDGRLLLANQPRVYLDDPGAESALLTACEGAALLIIDSFRAALRELDENDSRVRGPLNMLIRVSEATGCTVLVVHHSRKPAVGATVSKNEIRGSSAIFEACESVFVLDPTKDQPTRVLHEKAGITGVTREDFLLHVRDVEIDGRPRGGLAVTIEDVGNVDVFEQQEAASKSKLDRIKGKLIDEFRKCRTLPGAETLATRLHNRASAIRAALLAMADEGMVKVEGTTQNRTYKWIGGEL